MWSLRGARLGSVNGVLGKVEQGHVVEIEDALLCVKESPTLESVFPTSGVAPVSSHKSLTLLFPRSTGSLIINAQVPSESPSPSCLDLFISTWRPFPTSVLWDP